jgi:hypothetical protein
MKKKYSKALELLYELEDIVAKKRTKPNDEWDKGYNMACSNIGEDIRGCIEELEELFGAIAESEAFSNYYG